MIHEFGERTPFKFQLGEKVYRRYERDYYYTIMSACWSDYMHCNIYEIEKDRWEAESDLHKFKNQVK